MKLVINDEPGEWPGVQTLPELIEALGLPGPALLVEHNGVALHRNEWEGRLLAEGDRLEMLQIAAGG
jgi:thiamine biosynthesis protein ThiS